MATQALWPVVKDLTGPWPGQHCNECGERSPVARLEIGHYNSQTNVTLLCKLCVLKLFRQADAWLQAKDDEH